MERVLSNLKRGKPVTKIMFLLPGIFVLSLSLILSSCGKGPKTKALPADRGAFAIDLSLAPGDFGTIFVTNNTLPSIAETEFTIEVWVKSKTSNLSSGIFSRYDAEGTIMWVKDNRPKFAIRRLALMSGATTSTDYIVDSGVTITEDTWYHIAGVLTVIDHSSDPNCGAVGAEAPHLEIYIDGGLKACATTFGNLGDPATGPQFAKDSKGDIEAISDDNKDTNKILSIGRLAFAGDPKLDCDGSSSICAESDQPQSGLDNSDRFNGVIDELRFWTVARTQQEIQQCMNQKLGIEGDCKIEPAILKGYWLFNTGESFPIPDSSGYGLGGGASCNCDPPDNTTIPWVDGWVDGVL